MAKVFNTIKLEESLQSRWTDFVNKSQLMRTILEHVRDSEYRVLQKDPPTQKTQVSVSFHSSTDKTEYTFEIWTEFTVPKDKGTVIGTHVYSLQSNGSLKLKETYGTHFLPETS